MNKFIEVHITFPNEETGQSICNALVAEKLAACANLFPVQSIYTWESKINNEPEWAASIKTTPGNLETLIHKVKSMHPYQLPAITWSEAQATPEYLDWINESLIG